MGNRIHYTDNENYACSPVPHPIPNRMSLSPKNVTCIACLKLIIKEWREQVDSFTGQPLKNAKNGLKLAEKLLEEALLSIPPQPPAEGNLLADARKSGAEEKDTSRVCSGWG